MGFAEERSSARTHFFHPATGCMVMAASDRLRTAGAASSFTGKKDSRPLASIYYYSSQKDTVGSSEFLGFFLGC